MTDDGTIDLRKIRDDAAIIVLSKTEARTIIEGTSGNLTEETFTEMLTNHLDKAQGDLSTGREDEAYIIIKVTL